MALLDFLKTNPDVVVTLFDRTNFGNRRRSDAGEQLIKAGVVVKIDRTIGQRRLTQAAAAELKGIDQPKVSSMLARQFRGGACDLSCMARPARARPLRRRG